MISKPIEYADWTPDHCEDVSLLAPYMGSIFELRGSYSKVFAKLFAEEEAEKKEVEAL